MSLAKCTACGDHYNISDIKVVGHRDDAWFLNVYCTSCHRQSFVIAVIKKDKSLEIVSDLTDAESAGFTRAAAINSDDMLDLHNFLEDFDGDFIRLFSRK